MKRLVFLLCAALAAGCATLERPKPLAEADVVALAKAGRSAPQIIDELERTRTVLPLEASDFLRLHRAGVPAAVLDHLQRAQIEEIRWRDRYSQFYGFGPWGAFGRGVMHCPWPPGRGPLDAPWRC